MLAWNVLVCAEIVDETADDVSRNLLDVRHHSVNGIALEYGDDLVISLVMVEKPETSDRAGIHDDVTVGHILLGEDADIQRVTVTFDVLSTRALFVSSATFAPQYDFGRKP